MQSKALVVGVNVSVSKVEKAEVRGVYRGADVKSSTSVKVDQSGKATVVTELSAGVAVGGVGVSGGVSAEKNSSGVKAVKAAVKADLRLGNERISGHAGVGTSF